MICLITVDCVILLLFLSYLSLSSSCTQQLGPAEGFFLLGAGFSCQCCLFWIWLSVSVKCLV